MLHGIGAIGDLVLGSTGYFARVVNMFRGPDKPTLRDRCTDYRIPLITTPNSRADTTYTHTSHLGTTDVIDYIREDPRWQPERGVEFVLDLNMASDMASVVLGTFDDMDRAQAAHQTLEREAEDQMAEMDLLNIADHINAKTFKTAYETTRSAWHLFSIGGFVNRIIDLWSLLGLESRAAWDIAAYQQHGGVPDWIMRISTRAGNVIGSILEYKRPEVLTTEAMLTLDGLTAGHRFRLWCDPITSQIRSDWEEINGPKRAKLRSVLAQVWIQQISRQSQHAILFNGESYLCVKLDRENRVKYSPVNIPRLEHVNDITHPALHSTILHAVRPPHISGSLFPSIVFPLLHPVCDIDEVSTQRPHLFRNKIKKATTPRPGTSSTLSTSTPSTSTVPSAGGPADSGSGPAGYGADHGANTIRSHVEVLAGGPSFERPVLAEHEHESNGEEPKKRLKTESNTKPASPSVSIINHLPLALTMSPMRTAIPYNADPTTLTDTGMLLTLDSYLSTGATWTVFTGTLHTDASSDISAAKLNIEAPRSISLRPSYRQLREAGPADQQTLREVPLGRVNKLLDGEGSEHSFDRSADSIDLPDLTYSSGTAPSDKVITPQISPATGARFPRLRHVVVKLCDVDELAHQWAEEGETNESISARIANEKAVYDHLARAAPKEGLVPTCYGLWRMTDRHEDQDIYIMLLEHGGGAVKGKEGSDEWHDLHPAAKQAVRKVYNRLHELGVIHGDLATRHVLWPSHDLTRLTARIDNGIAQVSDNDHPHDLAVDDVEEDAAQDVTAAASFNPKLIDFDRAIIISARDPIWAARPRSEEGVSREIGQLNSLLGDTA